MFVSEKHDYISGNLYPVEDGYDLVLMLGDRSPNAVGIVSVLQNDGDYYREDPSVQTVTIGPDEPAILHITDLVNQSVRAILMYRNKEVRRKTYSLQQIAKISDGVYLNEYPAERIFA